MRRERHADVDEEGKYEKEATNKDIEKVMESTQETIKEICVGCRRYLPRKSELEDAARIGERAAHMMGVKVFTKELFVAAEESQSNLEETRWCESVMIGGMLRDAQGKRATSQEGESRRWKRMTAMRTHLARGVRAT